MQILFVVQITCRYTYMVKHTDIFLQLPVVNSPKIKSSKYAYSNIKPRFCESESEEIHSSICRFMTTPCNLHWWMCSTKKCTINWLLLLSTYNTEKWKAGVWS